MKYIITESQYNLIKNDINEAYTPWVKRRLKMVRNAERQSSSYMTHKFKQNPQQYRKNQFIDVFFSVMMDELHRGTEDFDYENIQQQLKDSFGEYVEELWKKLNK